MKKHSHLFTFIIFLTKKKDSIYDVTFSNLESYSKLADEKIVERLEDEHNRAKEIDDKTFKFTLALSISLSIVSAGASGVVKFLPESYLSSYISFVFFSFFFLYALWGAYLIGFIKNTTKIWVWNIF
ncbi:hypothetical protein AYY16_14180 [Morganella psychrotolerans]|uniref:hypothetical protein n=1 Tax=Morganella psychrotolerans TaxID=368603 RepID=UPI0007FC6A81|nr:hypothetical protein [Morganella psychrotolerans]OBU03599.1 hypothetical protein AYY16_14180 [Morganella psychrotolerans]